MKQKAFTLIELLVVIGIIGILSAIGVVSFGAVREKARRGACIATLRSNFNSDENLVAYWNFDEQSPGTIGTGLTLKDFWGHNGVIQGDPVYVDGIIDSALKFDGTLDYSNVSIKLPKENFTFSFWFKLNNDATNRGVWQYFMSSNGWGLYQHSANNLIYFYLGGARYISWVPTNNIWHHLACSVTSSGQIGGPAYQANCYADGSLKPLGQGGYLGATNNLIIGYNGNVIDGVLDELILYDRVLSADEIASHYKACKK